MSYPQGRRGDRNASRVPCRYRLPLCLHHDLERELGSRRCPVLRTPKRVAAVFQDLGRLDREAMVVGALDCKCRLLHWGLLAVGCADKLALRLGEAFQGAIRCKASGIVLVHNHPSGSLKPSREDLVLTREIAEAGRLLGYPLLDHLIVTRRGYKSLMRPAAVPTGGFRRALSAAGGAGVRRAAEERAGRLGRRRAASRP